MDYLERNRWRPQQVQDFMPTPMTLASDMYWSGSTRSTMKPVHVVRDMHEKRLQKALLRWAIRSSGRSSRRRCGAPAGSARGAARHARRPVEAQRRLAPKPRGLAPGPKPR